RGDAEEHLGLSILVPPPARLSRAGEGVNAVSGLCGTWAGVFPSLARSEESTALSFPPPLRGRGRVRGSHGHRLLGYPSPQPFRASSARLDPTRGEGAHRIRGGGASCRP